MLKQTYKKFSVSLTCNAFTWAALFCSALLGLTRSDSRRYLFYIVNVMNVAVPNVPDCLSLNAIRAYRRRVHLSRLIEVSLMSVKRDDSRAPNTMLHLLMAGWLKLITTSRNKRIHHGLIIPNSQVRLLRSLWINFILTVTTFLWPEIFLSEDHNSIFLERYGPLYIPRI